MVNEMVLKNCLLSQEDIFSRNRPNIKNARQKKIKLKSREKSGKITSSWF